MVSRTIDRWGCGLSRRLLNIQSSTTTLGGASFSNLAPIMTDQNGNAQYQDSNA